MKEVIYLNTDLIHSFMAQQNKGLPLSNTYEQLQQDSKSNADSIDKGIDHKLQVEGNTGSVEIPFVISSPSGKIIYSQDMNKQYNESITLTQIDAGKEIIAKQLHDNALIDFEEYLETNHHLHHIDGETDGSNFMGKYVKITSSFSLFDLDYLKKLTDSESMRKLILISSGQPTHNGSKKNRLGQDVERGLNFMETILKYLESILPTNIYLKQGNYLSPLNSQFLREGAQELSFKYGDSPVKITVLGRVTKTFESFQTNIFEESGNFIELSESISKVTNIFFKEINSIQKGDTIVSPIAIYFE